MSILNALHFCFWGQGLTMTLKLTDSAKLAGQWAEGLYLSLLPYATRDWTYRYRCCHALIFGRFWGSKVKSSSVHCRNLIHWNFSALLTKFTVITSLLPANRWLERVEKPEIYCQHPIHTGDIKNDSWKAALCRDRDPLTNNIRNLHSCTGITSWCQT